MSKLAARFSNFNNAAADNSAVGEDLQEFIDGLSPANYFQDIDYNIDGTVNQVIVYKNSNTTAANRRFRFSFGYDAQFKLITETIDIFNFNDGTITEKTTTLTFVYNGNGELQTVSQVTT